MWANNLLVTETRVKGLERDKDDDESVSSDEVSDTEDNSM